MADEERIDKWLWTVRLFKTRSKAAEACKKGRVMKQVAAVKPSATVRRGDIVQVKNPPVTYSFKVLDIAASRMGAKLVPQYMAHVTPPDQLQLIEMIRLDQKNARAKGTGRPTKKERRDLESFVDDTPYFIGGGDFDGFFDDDEEED